MSEVREMTVKEARQLLDWHAQEGRDDFVLKIDPRGLCFLKMQHIDVNAVAPPDGETHDAKRKVIFLSARF